MEKENKFKLLNMRREKIKSIKKSAENCLRDKANITSLDKDLKELKYTIKKEENTSKDITIVIKDVLDKGDIKTLTKTIEDKYNTLVDYIKISIKYLLHNFGKEVIHYFF